MPADMVEGHDKAVVQEAFDLERKILANAKAIGSATWELSRDLYELHERGLFRELGYDTLEEFLARPELGMSRAQFFRLTRTWRDLVHVRKVPEAKLTQLEPSKVQEVLPAVMKGDAILDDALDDAKELAFRDLRLKYGRASKQDKEKARGEYEPLGDDTVDDVEGTAGSAPDDLTPASAVGDGVTDDTAAIQDGAPVGGVIVPEEESDLPEPEPLIGPGRAAAQNDYEWLKPVAERIAEVLWEVALEVAPKEKKRMSNQLREQVYEAIELARSRGLVP